mgnify:CR=1 FL=1
MPVQLANMEFSELRDWLADRMHLRYPAAADVDRRAEEAPFDRPLSAWRRGDEEFRRTMSRAVCQILRETESAPWEAEYLHYLLTLVEEGEMIEAADILAGIARSRAWFRQEGGIRLHMLALRTLLGLGRRQTPDFWMRENRRLDGEYPRLIFRGLVSHGLTEAFRRLPEVALDVESAEKVAKLFPRLIEEHGLETICSLVAGSLDHLSDDVSRYFEEWFCNWGYGDIVPEGGSTSSIPEDDWEPRPEHFSLANMTEDEAEVDPGWQAGNGRGDEGEADFPPDLILQLSAS